MSIIIISSSYTQTTTSVNVTIPYDRTTLIVGTDSNSAPTFNGVSLTAGTSYNSNSSFYWWYYTNPPSGTYSLAAVGNTILNNFVLDNVSQTTPLSTQYTIPSATFNANGTVYTINGDTTTPFAAWFGVASRDYPGGSTINATSITNGTILSNVTSIVNAATLTIPTASTANPYTVNYNTTGSGIFSCPSPSWIFLNNVDIVRDIPQMIII